MKSHHGGMVIDGDYLYGTDEGVLKCLEIKSGNVMWQNRSVGKGAVVYVDGQIILRSEEGPVALLKRRRSRMWRTAAFRRQTAATARRGRTRSSSTASCICGTRILWRSMR